MTSQPAPQQLNGLNSVKSIIFDFGGVIINLNYQRTIDALSQLAGFDVASLYTQHRQDPLFDQFETGQISADTFRAGLRQILGVDCPDDALDAAWNAMLLDIPKERLDLLQRLKTQYRTFLCSNTNEIHKTCFDRIVQQHYQQYYGQPSGRLDDLFEAAYYSHLMGDRKPHPSIFRTLITRHNLDPAHTLFLEDTPQHLAGAQSVGLKTCQITSSRHLLTLGL
jgi:FMN phosphatase YigB (HAD superfamily)